MPELEETIRKLCEVSEENPVNPYADLDWPEAIDPDAWCFTPELLSLFGSEAFARLNETEAKRLAFFETVNFMSLNIHGEKALVEGLARRLYRRGNETISPYLHHFLAEENNHMVYFGGFCTRYARKIYPDRKLVFEREYAPGEEDFLFFTKVLIFEEIVDVYNVRMAKDERLAPIARRINLLHHQEETRHLAFGRRLVRELFETGGQVWDAETLHGIREQLAAYLAATWKEYYNPDVYRDAGLSDSYTLARDTFASASSVRHRTEVTGKCIRYLLENGILEKEPLL